MKLKKRKLKKNIERILNSWIGCLLYVLIGLLLVYLIFPTATMFYFGIIIFVPFLFLTGNKDTISSIYFAMILAFGTYKLIGLFLSTPVPIVAVVSPSMQHDNPELTFYGWLEKNLGYNRSYINSWPINKGFEVGDMPIVIGSNNYNIGDVIVYSVPGSNFPIIHRIVKINDDGTYQTKGDNNLSQLPYEIRIREEQIYGKVIFIIPKLGYVKVIMNKIFGV